MMSYLTKRVEAVLKNPDASPWFPDLTIELVEDGWRDLYNNAGLLPDTYGTVRAMTRNAGAARRIVARLPIFTSAESLERVFLIEIIDPEHARCYKQDGFRFYTAEEINTTNVLTQIRKAVDVVKPISTLFTTVAALVSSIHVIDVGDNDYDVSFSDPHIPFSIFVSVPRSNEANIPLRIAEAIIHEAMHIQLTLIERIVPLVNPAGRQHYSPWRGEFRNAQGVLHGLYVFRVIDECFYELQQLFSQYEQSVVNFIVERRIKIHDEINQIISFQDSSDLTVIGTEFVRRLFVGAQKRWASERTLTDSRINILER
jgi:hypothetical protein